MSVRRIDREKSTVDLVAENTILHADRAVMAMHCPLVSIRAIEHERLPAAIKYAHIENISRELVQRIAAWRRSAHSDLERRGTRIRERHLHLRESMLWFWK
jgi:hypothetical protein